MTLKLPVLVIALLAPPMSGMAVAQQAEHGEPQSREDPRPTLDAGRFLTSRKSPLTLPLPDEKDSFFFMIYGDRTGGPDSGIALLRQAVQETNLIGPDLVMTVGDLVNGYNEPEAWLRQMEEYRDAMEPLRMPWFPVAGNHDIAYRPKNRSLPIPPEEHEVRYEMYFGPLWYAFQHKSAWFIVLYTDEPNPETGERSFSKPECQRMSPEQLAWLDETLAATKDAAHVFVFCHHPRWHGGKYGDDWDKVHRRLVAAGNVKGVFAGHIHRMSYDPKDGIEYFTVATVGGTQGGSVPEAGHLQCYDLVTVRPDRIDRATLPLGAAMDPREITGRVSIEAPELTLVDPEWKDLLHLAPDGEVSQALGFTITNPVTAPVELEAYFGSSDPRWTFVPDHLHGKLAPGETFSGSVQVTRSADSMDGGLALPFMDLDLVYLTETARFSIPRKRHATMPDPASLAHVAVPPGERVLELSAGPDCARVPSANVQLPDGPFTVEAWVHPNQVADRQGLVCKTENSEYGLFANGKGLTFFVHLGGAYVEAKYEDEKLATGRWSHVAGVFDGSEVRLYLDGQLLAALPGQGPRKPNDLDLIIGGDVSWNNQPNGTLDGQIDEVRLSKSARYHGDEFTPSRRFTADDDTVLLLHMDGTLGRFLAGEATLAARLEGAARLRNL